MTDDNTTHDSTDDESTTESVNRRTFLQGAAVSAAGLTGASLVTEAGSAASSSKGLFVHSKASGKQTYEIKMASGGQIQKGFHANKNDSVDNGNTRVQGEVYNSYKDSYTYTGEIEYVKANGAVTFDFRDGAFSSTGQLDVNGQGPGRHAYQIATDSGDIDLLPGNTEGVDSEDGGYFSEYSSTSDSVSGEVWGQKQDSYTVNSGAVNRITLSGGHAQFRAQSQFDSGEAVLYFFYLGDSQQMRLFQESTNINEALKGYDRKMLLKHDYQHDNITSAGAVQNADKVVRPTRQNFEHCLQQLRNDGYTIDLYIQSHGYKRGGFKMSHGQHGSEDVYTASDIRGLKSSVGDPVPLRMVYQMNCWGSRLNSAWRDAGAKAVLGSRYVNFYPHEIMSFANAWRHGHKFHDALGQSRFERGSVNMGLAYGHAPATNDDWSASGSGCPFLTTILGNNQCAREYFVNEWNHDQSSWNDYPNRRNGVANIENASEKIIAGNGDLTNHSYY